MREKKEGREEGERCSGIDPIVLPKVHQYLVYFLNL
jgi:hypothetical protein